MPLAATALFLGPYYSGNTLVDVVLFGVWSFLFGLFLGWGMKVSQKLP